jgi:predicted esterase
MIAPQASSKYYLNGEYKHVGASWLTRENTQAEIENVMANLNAIYHAEQIPEHVNFFVLGFSQGVSVAMRWVARYQISCAKLIVYAGSIPNELTEKDFEFIHPEKTKIINIVGLQDPYFTEARMQQEHEKMQTLFGEHYIFKTYEGTHKVDRKALQLLEKL